MIHFNVGDTAHASIERWSATLIASSKRQREQQIVQPLIKLISRIKSKNATQSTNTQSEATSFDGGVKQRYDTRKPSGVMGKHLKVNRTGWGSEREKESPGACQGWGWATVNLGAKENGRQPWTVPAGL